MYSKPTCIHTNAVDLAPFKGHFRGTHAHRCFTNNVARWRAIEKQLKEEAAKKAEEEAAAGETGETQ